MEAFLGTIMAVGFNFAPRGWAFCDGRLLSVNNNAALYALLGTTYGGNGVNTFALPNLQGRTAIGMTILAGMNNRVLGQTGGVESVALTTNQLPVHTHALKVANVEANSETPLQYSVLAKPQVDIARGNTIGAKIFKSGSFLPTDLMDLSSQSIGISGQGLAHENMPPYLVINYIIAIEGIFPSRN